MSEQSKLFNYFWYFINISKNAFLFNSSSFMANIGRRRSGKSVFGLSAACATDPDFKEENITFGLKELKAQLNTQTQTSILWEEAGASAYSRDFMEEWNKLIVKTFQVFAYRKLAVYCNFQHLKFLDGDVRLQLDCIFRMNANNELIEGQPITHTFAEPFSVITDYIQEPLIVPYKVPREGVYSPIGKIPIPSINEFFELCNVKKSLYKTYLKKKEEYFQEIGETEKPAEKETIFSKKELKTLTRANQAYLSLASKLIFDEKMTKARIAELSDIPVSTLSVWLAKTEEAQELYNRILTKETTTK